MPRLANKRPSVAAGISIGTGNPSGSISFSTASNVSNKLRSGFSGPASWFKTSNAAPESTPAIAVSSEINASGVKIGRIRPSKSTETSPGTTLICLPPRMIVGLSVFRNSGLNVWPFFPSSFRVAAVNLGFNRAFMARRETGGRFLPMTWNINWASGVTWVGSCRDWISCKNVASAFMGLFCWPNEAWPPGPRKVTLILHTCFSATMIG